MISQKKKYVKKYLFRAPWNDERNHKNIFDSLFASLICAAQQFPALPRSKMNEKNKWIKKNKKNKINVTKDFFILNVYFSGQGCHPGEKWTILMIITWKIKIWIDELDYNDKKSINRCIDNDINATKLIISIMVLL